MPQEVEQVQTSAHAGWSGKMSPEPLAPTKERTLGQSSKKQSKSQSRKPPLFLSLRTDGPQPGASLVWGGEWSVAWRVFDAQFWGVPQRRKRIALVADFGGLTAPEILFERQGVPGYCPQSTAPWQRAATAAQSGIAQPGGATFCIQGNCIDRADTAGCNGKGWTEGVSYTLNTIDRPAVYSEPLDNVASTLRAGAGMPKHDADIRGRLAVVVGESTPKAFSFDSLSSNSMKSSNPHSGCREVGVSKTLDATRPDPSKNQDGIAIVQLAVEHHPQDSRAKISEDGVVQTLNGKMGTGGGNVPLILENR